MPTTVITKAPGTPTAGPETQLLIAEEPAGVSPQYPRMSAQTTTTRATATAAAPSQRHLTDLCLI
jgi:hypothetical protein